VRSMYDYAKVHGTSLFHAAEQMAAEGAFSPKIHTAIVTLLQQFHRWRGVMQELPVADAVEIILEESGYLEYWKNEKTIEGTGRVENIRELVRALAEFESVTAFLEHISLVTD